MSSVNAAAMSLGNNVVETPVVAPVIPSSIPTPAEAASMKPDPIKTETKVTPEVPLTPKPEGQKAIEKRLEKYKLKVDGKEYDEEIDLNDREYVTKQLQLAKAAQKRMGEHAQLEKEVRGFIDELRKNPRKVLSDPNIGIDIKKLAAQVIEEEIANSQKSPEQLEKEKLQAELQEMKTAREQEQTELKQREFERLQKQEYERYDVLMSQALDKSDLPKSPYVIKKMADYMLLGINAGKDVSPEDVLPLVRDEIQNDLKQMFAVMPEDVIERIIGKDVFTKIRKKNVATGKAKVATGITPTVSTKPETGPSGKKANADGSKLTFKQFFGV